jgi:hypothetical protein
VTAAVSASQAKGAYLRNKFHRLKARMRTKKAAMAVAHKILIAVFHMLQRGATFADLGSDYLDCVNKHSRPSAWLGVSPRSATTSCSNLKPQANPSHDPNPACYRFAYSNFRASHVSTPIYSAGIPAPPHLLALCCESHVRHG